MKIAILGGTGYLGKGLALRWAEDHHITIGSRFRDKAEDLAAEYIKMAEEDFGLDYSRSIEGSENQEAAGNSEMVVLTVPGRHVLDLVTSLDEELTKKVVLSPVVPMSQNGKIFFYDPGVLGSDITVSAAEAIQERAPDSEVVSAFHTISWATLADLQKKPSIHVLVMGDNDEAVQIVSGLVEDIQNLRALYGGPLSVSRMAESMTPLLINASRFGGVRDPSIKIVEF